jgi:prepilin-type N-terminal cleavage/methylation domain-containing protein
MFRMRADTSGFTLIEVLVALTVMAFAVVYLVHLFSSNLRLISTSGEYMDSFVQAESKMREILSRNKFEETSWREETDEGYRVDVSVTEELKERVQNLPMKLFRIEVNFSWQKALRKKNLTLTTLKMVNKSDNKATGD